MKKSYSFTIVALAFYLATASVTNFSFAQDSDAGNLPPVAEMINAKLNPPVTTYSVEAMDPNGDPLTYIWDADISCGSFRSSGNSGQWSHPHGNSSGDCPEQSTLHPGTISVHVSDGNGGNTRCSYSGSEDGIGPKCTGSSDGINSAPKSSNSSYPQTNFNSYYWFGWGWEWIALLFAAILLGGWLRSNGLFAQEEISSDPCAKEKAAEAAARAKMDSTKAAFDAINRAKQAADAAEQKAKEAKTKAERLRKAAGTRWSASADYQGKHYEREGWHNKEAGTKADFAEAEARAARETSNAAKSAFDAMGGNSSWTKANNDLENAKKEWEKADTALKICLKLASAPPSTAPPPAPAPSPTAPPPPTAPPSGPAVSTPTSTQTRVCINGSRRNEKTESITVQILNLQSVRLMQDKYYSDAGNEAMKFVDYLQTVKDIFMLGKKIKGGVEGFTHGSLTGTADAVGLPDFLTWYDKGIDELTKSMHKLYAIMQDKQRLGDYWLEYSTKPLTLTCTSSEVCTNDRWVKRCSLSAADGDTVTHRTNPQSVHDIRELRRAITRLFTQLRSRYSVDKNRAKTFSDNCNKCS